mmetsp:Transcript_17034/g.32235  ORF Transcript_17034/g.32235 Transcript_17034/m.32235 type:complete len:307 (+) Transcript_17034:62-982(+)
MFFKTTTMPNFLNNTCLLSWFLPLIIFTSSLPVNSLLLPTTTRQTTTQQWPRRRQRQPFCETMKPNAMSRIASILEKSQNQVEQDDQFHHLLVPTTPCSSDYIRSRRSLLQSTVTNTAASLFFATTTISASSPEPSWAAPPIAIIAEELGYFPVTNRSGETVFVPAKVKRKSTEQSIRLAQYLRETGAVMYGAYWCPHCSHQKELFGNEAWSLIPYVECSTKGFYYNSSKVEKVKDQIEGFPTWYFPKGSSSVSGSGRSNSRNGKEWVSGEMPLERIVALSGFKGDFDVSLEGPPDNASLSSGSCG